MTPKEKRIIKFRAWDKKNKLMTSPFSTYIAPNGADGQMIMDTPNSDDFVLLQFTGLLDKNGKEIYEDDLLRYLTTNGKPSHIRQVIWNITKGRWQFKKLRVIAEESHYVREDKAARHEIIGNVYENSELLT